MSDNTALLNAIEDVEAASQQILSAVSTLQDAGSTIDSNSVDLERDILLNLHRKVTEAKDLASRLDYIEPSSTSCSC